MHPIFLRSQHLYYTTFRGIILVVLSLVSCTKRFWGEYVEEFLHEAKIHGTLSFPYMVYRGRLPEYLRSYPIHWHKEMEIIYIVSGRGTVTVQHRRYTVGAGDIVLIAPETLHAIEQLDQESMEYFNILFDFHLLECSHSRCYEKYLRPIFEHTSRMPVCLRCAETLAAQITPSLRYLIENRKHMDVDGELMVKAQLYAILHHIRPYCRPCDEAALRLENHYDKIKEVLYYVQEHYGEHITVEDAANIVHFSPSYFSKLFHSLTGASFIRYVKEYRLEAAAEKLVVTNTRVTDIAQDVGFSSLPYFSRAFFGKFGLTPNAYRKRARGEGETYR